MVAYKFLSFGLLLLLFHSCTEIVDLSTPSVPQQPVMFTHLTPDSNIQVFVYKSMPMGESLENAALQDVSFSLFEDEKELDIEFAYESKKYTSEYKPLVNKSYTLRAHHAQFGEFTTKDRIPQNVEVTNIKLENNVRYIPIDDYWLSQVNFTLHDDPKEENYYEFYVYDYSKSWLDNFSGADTIKNTEYMKNYTSESPLFRDENLLQYKQDESLILSDAGFNGKQQQVNFQFNGVNHQRYMKYYAVYLCVRTISKASFDYKKSLLVHSNTRGLQEVRDVSELASYSFMFTPAQVTSNVENGLGNTICYSEKRYVLFEYKNF